jgi:hypothetical protein
MTADHAGLFPEKFRERTHFRWGENRIKGRFRIPLLGRTGWYDQGTFGSD